MKKNFFKKLSFVLALAMIISVVAPAAGAFASAKPTLNSTQKYLHLGDAKLGQFNFNINGTKQSGWKYAWDSANTKIATVNAKNGVTTAAGVGTTKVTCVITDKNNKEVAVLKATVIVRDNIKELTIRAKGNPDFEKLAVDTEYDFDRGFTTNSGSTTKTSGITRWTVDDAENASIVATNGIFKATKAGEYTITARAFQSTARYNSWLKDKDDAKWATAVKEQKVKVGASMLSADQIDLKSFKVTFDSEVADAASKLEIFTLVGTTKVRVSAVKPIKLDADKKVATVELYVDLTEDVTYVAEYPGLGSKSFKAATTKATDVAKLEVVTKEIVAGTSKDIEVKLFNQNNVNITTTALLNRVTYKNSNDRTWLSGKNLTIFNKGDNTVVTATFHSYKWEDGKEVGNVEGSGTIVGVDAAAATIGTVTAWTMVTGGSPNFDDQKQRIAAGDENLRLFVRLKRSLAGTDTNVDSNVETSKFKFTSSDNSILLIDNSGNLVPIKQGTAVVVVKYDDKDVDAITINVGAKRTATTLDIGNTTTFNLSNVVQVGDSATITVKVKDQYGDDMTVGTVERRKLAGAPTGEVARVSGSSVIVEGAPSGASATTGSYAYEIKAKDLVRYITVNVSAPNDTASYWRLQLDKSSVDTAIKADGSDAVKSVTVELFGYAPNGVKAQKVILGTTPGFKVDIEAPKSADNSLNNTGSYALTTAVSGAAITKKDAGTYKVSAFREVTINSVATWVPVDVTYFTVSDTQKKPVIGKTESLVYTVPVVDAATALAAVRECFKITLDGADVNANIQSVDYVGAGNQIHIRKVVVRQNIGTSWINHDVTIGLTVTQRP